MANPPTAKAFAQALDPSDELDYHVFLLQAEQDHVPAPMLLPGEAVDSYSLALTPEAAAAGLRIMSGDDRKDRLVNNWLTLWFDVAPEMRAAPMFDGGGVLLGVEMTIRTTSVPSRKKQRTFLVPVANQ